VYLLERLWALLPATTRGFDRLSVGTRSRSASPSRSPGWGGPSHSAVEERGLLRVDSMMADFVKSEPCEQGNVERLIISPSPSTCPSIRLQRVQHLGEMFSVGNDCSTHLSCIFIVVTTVDGRTVLVLVLEAWIVDVDRELDAIGKERQRVADMACVLERRPCARRKTSPDGWCVAEPVEQLVPRSCFVDDSYAEVSLYHRRWGQSALRARSASDDEKPPARHGLAHERRRTGLPRARSWALTDKRGWHANK
jgi:hypothetical protein